VRIGRMIAYQEYNSKSPLNGLAAKWSEQHANLFPVDTRDLAPPLDKPRPAAAPVASPDASKQTPQALSGSETPPSPAQASSNRAAANEPAAAPWTEPISIE